MGPKKAKKPKKTKEELEAERIEREQEEARIKEEERIREEQERQRREEEERKRVEEAARQRALELERLHKEYEEHKDQVKAKNDELTAYIQDENVKYDWKKYLACATGPDVCSEADINSYINTLSQEQHQTLQSAVKECSSANELITDLMNAAADANSCGETERMKLYFEFTRKIQSEIRNKLDASTAMILQFHDEATDAAGKSELKRTAQSNWIKAGIWINLIPKGVRTKHIDFPDINISLDIPKPVVVQHLALRAVYLPYDDKSTNSRDRALGGVFCVDLLSLPAAPKKIKGWTIREVQENQKTVNIIPYPFDGMVASAVQPIRIQIQIPKDTVLDECPRVGWWDENENEWNEEGISEVIFERESGLLHFHTTKLTYMGILQERNLNFHSTSWKFQHQLDSEHLDKTGKAIGPLGHFLLRTPHYPRIHIEICFDECRLRFPKLPELKELNTQYHSPGDLLNKLSLAGINIIPSTEDDKIFEHVPKDQLLESQLITEICSIASSFDISSHDPSNSYCHLISKRAKSAAFQIKPLKPPPLTDLEDEYFEELERKQYHVIAQVDSEAPNRQVKFSLHSSEENIYDNYVYLKNAAKPITTPDTTDRLRSSSVVFENTLKKLLHLIRPFSYCQPQKGTAVVDEDITLDLEVGTLVDEPPPVDEISAAQDLPTEHKNTEEDSAKDPKSVDEAVTAEGPSTNS